MIRYLVVGEKMTKRVLWLLLALALVAATAAFAGVVPRLVNFQGRLTDAVGSPVADGSHTLTFRFYTSSSGGSLLWAETQTVTTAKGIFSVILGAVDSLPPYVFAGDSCFLELEPQGSTPLVPRSRITTVPYAYRAQNSDLLSGLSATDFASPGYVDNAMSEHLIAPDPHNSKTINAGDLVIGTLDKARLPKHAIDSTNIVDASLSSQQIVDAPGISHTSDALMTLPSAMRIIDSAYMIVPAWGYVLVIASGWFYVSHTSGLETHATISISASRTTHESAYTAKFDVATNAPAGHTSEDFAIQRVLTVGPGPVKFFLLGNMVGTELPNVQSLHLNTLFIPKSYGEIDAVLK